MWLGRAVQDQPKASESSLVRIGKVWTGSIPHNWYTGGLFCQGHPFGCVAHPFVVELSAVLFPVAVAGLFCQANKQGALAGLIAGTLIGVKMLLFGPEFDPVFGMYGECGQRSPLRL